MSLKDRLINAAFIGFPLITVLIVAFIGFVKFMAWWRVAFGSCSP